MKNDKVMHISEYCPAFPTSGHNGMSLRDYFATKAMQGMIASGREFHMPNNKLSVEIKAYALADAMLVERNKSEELRGG